MILFRYLDNLPPIPKELLKSPIRESDGTIWETVEREVITNNGTDKNLKYTRWLLTVPLKQWIYSNISERGQIDQLGLQISAATNGASTHLCHTDSYPRKWVLNYMFETGGDNVWTHFYKERGQPLIRDHLTRPSDMTQLDRIYSVKIEPNRWWLLNAVVLHDVTGVETQRSAITAGYAADNPFDRIIGYRGLLLQ